MIVFVIHLLIHEFFSSISLNFRKFRGCLSMLYYRFLPQFCNCGVRTYTAWFQLLKLLLLASQISIGTILVKSSLKFITNVCTAGTGDSSVRSFMLIVLFKSSVLG